MLPLAAEELLHRRAGGGQRDAALRALRRELQPFEQRGAGLTELAGCRLGSGEGGEKLDSVLDRRVVAQKSQRGPEPARRSRRRAPGGLVAASREMRPRRHRPGEHSLDVMCPCSRGSSATRKCFGGSLVRAETPAAGRRLVHRSTDQRVTETESARDLGLTDEIATQQLVERLDHVCLVDPGRGRDELRLERIARDGCTPEDDAHSSVSSSSSSASEAATAGGTSTPASAVASGRGADPRARSADRASCSR